MKHDYSLIAIVGGGASGMAAAITAAQVSGRRVILFERQQRVGRKLLATGNGRCNLSNNYVFDGWHGTTSNMISAQAANTINNRLSVLAAGSYDPFTVVTSTDSSVNYWTSSEYDNSHAIAVSFTNEGSMLFATDMHKSTACKIRPVIAF